LINTYTIAITGKGGTGKTTIAASIVSSLINKSCVPVLAVDADPNSCLDLVLGVEVKKTVGQIREESRSATANQKSGIAKRKLVELKIAEGLVEADNFDLIAMGRPEGPGCYCYANNLFSDVIKALSKNYPFIVIDNEAGLENLSRRLVQKTNLLIIVGDTSLRGIKTIKRLHELARDMGIEYEQLAVFINMIRNNSEPDEAKEIARQIGADFLVFLPFDQKLAQFGESGESILTLPRDNAVLAKIDGFLSELNLKGK
jgi:CO dehydrogenase maturation factor